MNIFKINKKIHYYNYPSSPRIKVYIERFNRTVQEQFFDQLDNVNDINEELKEYLLRYNTRNIYKWLNYKFIQFFE